MLEEDCDDGDSESTVVAEDGDCDGVLLEEDCDDTNIRLGEPAEEICDGLDNNCDGQVDEGVLQTYYADSDGDGLGVFRTHNCL